MEAARPLGEELTMRLIATTVVRKSKKRVTGFVYDVDWTSGEILRQLPVPEPRFPEADDNPRGGVRGGRGVAATPRGIVVATYDTLHRYDHEWNVLDSFSHPLFVDIHEIDWDGDSLWVTATGIDAVLRVSPDWDVEVAWDPYPSPLAQRLGIGKRSHAIDGSLDYRIREAPLIDRCHINSVIRRNGSTVVNFGLVRTPRSDSARLADRVLGKLKGWDGRGRVRKRPGRTLVARLDGDEQAEVLIDVPPHRVPWHNGQLLGDSKIVVNDSTSKALRVFGLPDGREVRTVHVPARWLRGLVPLDESRLLVGLGPAAIALVDLERGAVERTVQLSEERREAVHGLTLHGKGSS